MQPEKVLLCLHSPPFSLPQSVQTSAWILSKSAQPIPQQLFIILPVFSMWMHIEADADFLRSGEEQQQYQLPGVYKFH